MNTQQVFGDAYNLMTMDMRAKLGGYQRSLEMRYGDPRVYEAQREQMAAETAAVMYSQAKTHEQALSAAYGKNRDQIRETHNARIRPLTQGRGPQLARPAPQSRTPAPP